MQNARNAPKRQRSHVEAADSTCSWILERNNCAIIFSWMQGQLFVRRSKVEGCDLIGGCLGPPRMMDFSTQHRPILQLELHPLIVDTELYANAQAPQNVVHGVEVDLVTAGETIIQVVLFHVIDGPIFPFLPNAKAPHWQPRPLLMF